MIPRQEFQFLDADSLRDQEQLQLVVHLEKNVDPRVDVTPGEVDSTLKPWY